MKPRRHPVLNATSFLYIILAFFVFAALKSRFPESSSKNKPNEASIDESLFTWQPENARKSAFWKPLTLTKCVEGMSPYYAPCLDAPGLIAKEELIYPDFTISLPVFLNDSQRDEWALETAYAFDDEGRTFQFKVNKEEHIAIYQGQRGQNLVYEDAVWTRKWLKNSTSGWFWPEGYCMSEKMTHKEIQPRTSIKESSDAPLEWDGLAVVSITPDSHIFQHFTDHTLKIFAQSERWREMEGRKKSTVLIGPRPRDESVKHMLDILVGSWNESDGITYAMDYTKKTFSAAKMLFPCRCPRLHPYNALRARELLNMDTRQVPLADRKVVLYMTRTKTSQVYNGGRKVINEDQLLKRLESYLKKRGQGERIVLWDPAQYQKDMDGMVDFLSNHVRAFIGPESGAFWNYIWAGESTLHFQFVPRGRFSLMLWEEVALINQQSAVVIVDSVNKDDDMYVDPDDVMEILDKTLGVELTEPLVKPWHQWAKGLNIQ